MNSKGSRCAYVACRFSEKLRPSSLRNRLTLSLRLAASFVLGVGLGNTPSGFGISIELAWLLRLEILNRVSCYLGLYVELL